MRTPDPLAIAAQPADALLNSALARLTQGIAPASIAGAYLDWATHLAGSPAKWQELAVKAQRKLSRFALYAMRSAGGREPCIEPLPQDRRFEHPDWREWPFNLLQQGFLLAQQWWWNATTGVRGVDAHHEQVVEFVTRQWLDTFSPSNFPLTNPEVLRETAHRGGANLVQGAINWWDDALRIAANRPHAGLERWRVGENLALTPGKVVYRNHLVELIQYAPQTGEVRPEPLLVVPSWIMKYYILDLQPHNSLVRYLVGQGYTVFLISWKNPGTRERELGIDDYIKSGVLAALEAIARIVPGRRAHALGYCLGGTILAMAAALLAREGGEPPATLSLLAAETDFEEAGELTLFIDESQISFLEDMMFTRGYLDGKEMTGAFALLNSKDLVWSRMVHDYLMGRRDEVSDLMAWNADATRMPYRMHSEYLRRLYLGNDFTEGRLMVDGRPIALSDIRAPMFVVGTERDHVSPWRSVYKVNLFADTEVTFLLTSGGHNVGVVNPAADPYPGSGYRVALRAAEDRYVDPETWQQATPARAGSWWPEYAAWLDARSGAPAAPPAMGAPDKGLPPLYDAPGRHVLED
jgi:poly[(R)-3-hydroxyalkanoate] polymerase subunit PhaC